MASVLLGIPVLLVCNQKYGKSAPLLDHRCFGHGELPSNATDEGAFRIQAAA
jgi:hypothetical protein